MTLTGVTKSLERHHWTQFKKQDAANNNGKRTTAIRNAWGPHHSTPLACQTEAIETTGNTAPYNPWTNKNNPGTKVVVAQFLKLNWCWPPRTVVAVANDGSFFFTRNVDACERSGNAGGPAGGGCTARCTATITSFLPVASFAGGSRLGGAWPIVVAIFAGPTPWCGTCGPLPRLVAPKMGAVSLATGRRAVGLVRKWLIFNPTPLEAKRGIIATRQFANV